MAQRLITIEQARDEVLSCAHRLGTERVAIASALGRVLAQDVEAVGSMPPFSSSAMDGYAIRASAEPAELRVVGESRAGMPTGHRLLDGEAVRISTGAALPRGASAVVRQEDVEDRGQNLIRTLVAVAEGDNVRPAGEVLRAGTKVLSRGTPLGPAELATAITAGLSEVAVGRRPRVWVLSTGDELRNPGEALGPGEIHNSNGPMLAAFCARAGALVNPPVHLPDDLAATERGLGAGLDAADLVIVSGGVSVGPHDHVKPALARLGVREHFWGVALQPGKPTWFGARGAKLVFGLPGNPVSAAVTFALFVAPAIAALQGASTERDAAGVAVLGASVKRSGEREQALRVRLERREDGIVALPNGPQGSHVITSLIGADALALIPPGDGVLEPGAVVALHPLPR